MPFKIEVDAGRGGVEGKTKTEGAGYSYRLYKNYIKHQGGRGWGLAEGVIQS